MDEFKIIKKYFKKISNNNKSAKDLNDDVFFDKKKNLIVSIDTYNEGSHFPNFKYPNMVITKILRSSISDLIAKGVKPKYYFISGSGNKNHFTKYNLKLISDTLRKEQSKYKIKLSGGDTTKSKKISFSITTIGFSKKIVERNKSKLKDDIYVTGNIGDSFIGLNLIKKKIKLNSFLKNYFVNKYYCPEIPYKISPYLHKFANSSMDISDGLISDMSKLINDQNLSFSINIEKIPISKNLFSFLKRKKLKKENYIFQGDDYQILFTASENKRYIIKSLAKKMNQKITCIGKIHSSKKKNVIKILNKPLNIRKFRGYSHKF